MPDELLLQWGKREWQVENLERKSPRIDLTYEARTDEQQIGIADGKKRNQEVRKLERDAPLDAELAQRFIHPLYEGLPPGDVDVGVRQEGVEAQAASNRGVIQPHQARVGILEHDLPLLPRPRGHVDAQRQVDLSRLEATHIEVLIESFDLDAHVRCLDSAQAGQDRHDDSREHVGRGHAKAGVCGPRIEVGGWLERALQAGELRPQRLGQPLRVWRELHAGLRPDQERITEQLAELSERVAHRRLGHAEAGRRPGHAPRLEQGIERRQQVHVDAPKADEIQDWLPADRARPGSDLEIRSYNITIENIHVIDMSRRSKFGCEGGHAPDRRTYGPGGPAPGGGAGVCRKGRSVGRIEACRPTISELAPPRFS
jgi:hypothetical protein